MCLVTLWVAGKVQSTTLSQLQAQRQYEEWDHKGVTGSARNVPEMRGAEIEPRQTHGVNQHARAKKLHMCKSYEAAMQERTQRCEFLWSGVAFAP